MFELDLINHLKQITSLPTVSSIKAQAGMDIPAIVVQEINHTRNSQSSIDGKELQDYDYQLTYFTSNKQYENLVYIRELLYNEFEMYSGILGETNIMTTKVVSTNTEFNNNTDLYTYTMKIKFTILWR